MSEVGSAAWQSPRSSSLNREGVLEEPPPTPEPMGELPAPGPASVARQTGIRLEGHVEKQGEWMGAFKQRYVKLTDSGIFSHYTDENDDKARAQVSLKDSTVVAVNSGSPGFFGFVVRFPGNKSMSLRVTSQEDRSEWMEAIADGAKAANEQAAKQAAEKAAAARAKAEAESPTKPAASVTIVEPPAAASGIGGLIQQAASSGREKSASNEKALTSRSERLMTTEIEKSLNAELEEVRSQVSDCQARVAESQATLQKRVDELQVIQAEKKTKSGALAAKTDALLAASGQLSSYEESLTALTSSASAVSSTAASAQQSARGVAARLLAEKQETEERLKQRSAALAELEEKAAAADAEALAELTAAEEAHLSAKRESSATSTLRKLQTSQLLLLKKEKEAAEHEQSLAAKVLEGKKKLFSAAEADQSSLQQTLAAAEGELTKLSEREAALKKEDAAAMAAMRDSLGQLAEAERSARRLAEMQSDYIRAEGPTSVRSVLEGEEDTLAAELAKAEEAVRELSASQIQVKASAESAHEERLAQLRQLRAEQVAAQAVFERKSAHAEQQLRSARDLKAEVLKWSHQEAEATECVRIMAAEVEAQTKREEELSASLAATEATVKEKGELATSLRAKHEVAEGARKLEIESERKVVTQQQNYFKQLEDSVEEDASSEGPKKGQQVVSELLAAAAATVTARKARLETAQSETKSELETVEERLRSQEAGAQAEVSACTEMVETQKRELLQLQQHENAFMSS